MEPRHNEPAKKEYRLVCSFLQILDELEEVYERCHNTTSKASCIIELKNATKTAKDKGITDDELKKYEDLSTKLEKEEVYEM